MRVSWDYRSSEIDKGMVMLRMLAGAFLALALTGCWLSEQRLFGSGDWAAVDVANTYTAQNAEGDAKARVILTVRPDRSIGSISKESEEDSAETSIYGFVAIAGGSGNYFVVVDRSDETNDDDIYLIAHVTDDGVIDVYIPQCAGTPTIAGMMRERDPWIKEDVCVFRSKGAVMRAALEAERALSAPRMFELQRLARLVPVDELPEFEP